MYSAIICKITTRPHPNADRLKIGDALGNQVIVGLDTQDGDLGIFFPTDGQLSVKFAVANDLIRRKDANGNSVGGMFDENRRVRAQAFRGVKSDGFWCPISNLVNCGVSPATVDALQEGSTFTELDSIPICNKYFTPATLTARANSANSQLSKKLRNFPEHVDSEQYRFVKDTIPSGALITITEKLHGTSMRYGNIEVTRELNWFEKLLVRFGVKVETTEYRYTLGTRRTILKEIDTGTSFYGDESFRRNAVKGLTLHAGEMVYAELVGYTTTGATIMAAQDTSKLGKEYVKAYGARMDYTYGCNPGECKMYVYRITRHGVEYSHNQMVKRCQELGINAVPFIALFVHHSEVPAFLDNVVSTYMQGASTLDNRHIREGVVLRIETDQGVQFVKSKSTDFGILEGYLKEKPEYIDTEEVS